MTTTTTAVKAWSSTAYGKGAQVSLIARNCTARQAADQALRLFEDVFLRLPGSIATGPFPPLPELAGDFE